MAEEYIAYKSAGDRNRRMKKKNLGGVGRGRSDVYHSKRGLLKAEARYSHHSRRKIQEEGIQRGADSQWLPSTTCEQKRKNWQNLFGSFSKWRYKGDICRMVENLQPSDRELIQELVEKYPEEIDKIACKKCRYWFQKFKTLPTDEEFETVKETYRNRKSDL